MTARLERVAEGSPRARGEKRDERRRGNETEPREEPGLSEEERREGRGREGEEEKSGGK